MSDLAREEDGNLPLADWSVLRNRREARGLSLAQVSAHLKLTQRQLEAIEQGELSSLPGAAFSRGFVRNYARFLDIDPAPFLAAIDAAEGRNPVPLATQMYSPSLGRMPMPGDARFSALPAALLVVLLAAVLGAGWYFHWFEAREDEALLDSVVIEASAPVGASSAVPAVLASEPAATALAVASEPVAASAPLVEQSPAQSGLRQVTPVVAQSAPAPVAVQSGSLVAAVSQPSAVGLPRIVLAFDGESWVEVRDATDKVVFARLSQAGVVQEVQGSAPFTLVIGNAPKVRLNWKGRPVDLAPYIKGDVARLTVQ